MFRRAAIAGCHAKSRLPYSGILRWQHHRLAPPFFPSNLDHRGRIARHAHVEALAAAAARTKKGRVSTHPRHIDAVDDANETTSETDRDHMRRRTAPTVQAVEEAPAAAVLGGFREVRDKSSNGQRDSNDSNGRGPSGVGSDSCEKAEALPSSCTASVPSANAGDAVITTVSEATGDSDSHRSSRVFDIDGRGRFVAEPSPPRSLEVKLWRRVEALLGVVLPRGFPESVHRPYAAYATWQFTSMAASSAAGVMSTQALLYAMGMGAGALPLAVTLNWVIKDGLGQLGGVAFSSLVNTHFDANPKLWRTVAAVALDASMMLELLSPLAPAYFLLIASVANVGKNISFLAASASRAAIHNVLSAKGNLADVTAKSGAQTIVACMVGTGGGVLLSTVLGSDWHSIVPACLCLSAVHLSANYLSIRRLGMPTFDFQRLELMTTAFHGGHGIPTPEDLAVREQVVIHALRARLGLDRAPTVSIGSRLEEAVKDLGELERLCQTCTGLPFLLAIRGDLSSRAGEVHVLFLEGCKPRDVLTGSYVAVLAKGLLLQRGLMRPRQGINPGLFGRCGSEKAPRGEILHDVISEALRQGATAVSPPASPEIDDALENSPTKRNDFPREKVGHAFLALAERAGWDTSVLFLEKAGATRLELVHSEREGRQGVRGVIHEESALPVARGPTTRSGR